MALASAQQAALASSAADKQQINSQQQQQQQSFQNLITDFYLQQQQQHQQQQQQQQQQELLLSSYLQPLLQSTLAPSVTSSSSSSSTLSPTSSDNSTSAKRKHDATLSSEHNSKKQPQSQSCFKCDSCTANFESKKDLKKHAKQAHPKAAAAAAPNDLANDANSSSNEKLFECVKCELLFRNYEMYMKHKQLHDSQGDVLLTKKQPAESAANQSNQALAAAMESSVDTFKCSLCNIECSSAIQYLIHVQTEHRVEFSNANNSSSTGNANANCLTGSISNAYGN